MGLIGGGFAAAFALGTYFGGRISDRFERLTVIVTATLLLLPCLACVALTDMSSWLYYVAFVFTGCATGAVYPSLVAWWTEDDSGPRLNRKLMGFCLAWNFGMIAGHAVGGQLYDKWGHAAPMYCALSLLPFSLLLVLWGHRNRFYLPPVCAQLEDTTSDLAGDLSSLFSAFAILSWVTNIGGTFSISMVIFLLPELIVEIGVTSAHQGWLLAFSRGVVIATYLLMYASRRWRFCFLGGLFVQALAIVGLFYLATANGEGQLILGLTALSVLPGYNYFASLFYSTGIGDTRHRGTWCGLHEATFGAGLTLGSILGGWIGSHAGVRSCFLLAAVVVVIIIVVQIILYLKLVRPLRKTKVGSATKVQLS